MSENNYFPCPVCGKMLPVESTKNQKPYCKCNDCGVQLFVRGKTGIRRFKRLLGTTGPTGSCQELVSTLDHFRYLRRKLKEIQDEEPLLGTDSDLELQQQVIRKQLNSLRLRFKQELTE